MAINTEGIPTNTREYKGTSLLELMNDFVLIDVEATGNDPEVYGSCIGIEQ